MPFTAEAASTMASIPPSFTPLTPTIGLDVKGIDVRNAPPATIERLRRAFVEHKVLVLRDQRLEPHDQLAFGRQFGAFEIHPFREPIVDYPALLSIAKEPHERRNVGGGWHTDMTFMPEPPLATMLYAIEVPPGLGDTLFADNQAAFDALSPRLQQLLIDLEAIHCADEVHGVAATRDQSAYRQSAGRKAAATREVRHPVVRRHPESGRLGLFVNPAFTRRFDGMTAAESQPLLEFLYRHMTDPQFVVRVRWTEGALVLWDNRCTQHFALNDYHGQRREMHRLMVKGDRPMGV